MYSILEKIVILLYGRDETKIKEKLIKMIKMSDSLFQNVSALNLITAISKCKYKHNTLNFELGNF